MTVVSKTRAPVYLLAPPLEIVRVVGNLLDEALLENDLAERHPIDDIESMESSIILSADIAHGCSVM